MEMKQHHITMKGIATYLFLAGFILAGAGIYGATLPLKNEEERKKNTKKSITFLLVAVALLFGTIYYSSKQQEQTIQ